MNLNLKGGARLGLGPSSYGDRDDGAGRGCRRSVGKAQAIPSDSEGARLIESDTIAAVRRYYR